MSKKKNSKKTDNSKDAKTALKGSCGFEKYYQELFGDRWNFLRQALLDTPKYISWKPFSCTNSNMIDDPYFMDAGSVLAAFALPLPRLTMAEAFSDKQLVNLTCADFCAAPGGKSLVLASRLSHLDSWHFTTNERSNGRRARLIRNIEQQLPDCVRQNIKITGFDAARWCRYETEAFDRIFVDAPCSSERHVLSDIKYLNQWSPSRIKTLAQTQWSILSSAYRVLKIGGYLVYATCALSPLENDGVVARLLKKFDTARVNMQSFADILLQVKEYKTKDTNMQDQDVMDLLPAAEKTKYGYHVLPDVQKGAGPLYFSVIQKCN